MAPSNSIGLRQQRSSTGVETAARRDDDDEVVAIEGLDISTLPPSRRLSNRGKARVIAGNALLQLPIWGEFIGQHDDDDDNLLLLFIPGRF